MSRKGPGRNPGAVTSLVKQTRADVRQPRSASRGASLRNVRESEERAEGAAQYEEQIAALKQDIKRRQASYVRRENEYKARIQELEQQVERARAGEGPTDDEQRRFDPIRSMHGQILSHIDEVKGRTAKILREQESDLLRAFRARLFDVQAELDAERAKADDGAAVYIERARQLEKQLDWTRDMANRLEKANQQLTKDNARLRMQFQTQEDDREYLIRQLVAVKKDNARLRREIDVLRVAKGGGGEGEGEPSSPVAGTGRRRSAASPRASRRLDAAPQPAQASGGGPRMEARNAETVRRLRRVLESERRNLRQARSSLQRLLSQRTELEIFLRQCVDDVRGDIAARRDAMLAGPHHAAGGGARAAAAVAAAAAGSVRPETASGVPRSRHGASTERRGPASARARSATQKLLPGPSRGSATARPTTADGTFTAGARHWSASSDGAAPDESGVQLQDFTKQDRERVLELLLSQERVISLLYDRTFLTSERPPSGLPGRSERPGSGLPPRPGTTVDGRAGDDGGAESLPSLSDPEVKGLLQELEEQRGQLGGEESPADGGGGGFGASILD